MILCTFTMFIACGVFAYAVNQIGEIFQEFSKVETEIKRKMFIINTYMNSKNVKEEVRYQVRQYLEYFWRETKNENEEEEEKIIN